MLHFFSHIMTKRKNLPFNYSKISVLNEHMDGRGIPLPHLLAILGTTSTVYTAHGRNT